VIGRMLQDWDKKFPGRIETMFRSLQNIVPSHLADSKLFDFQGLAAQHSKDGELPVSFDGGDTAFDHNPEFEAAMQLDVSRESAKPVTFITRSAVGDAA
jgi:tRNA 2-thiocytidine biosynthesis protein TtcA